MDPVSIAAAARARGGLPVEVDRHLRHQPGATFLCIRRKLAVERADSIAELQLSFACEGTLQLASAQDR
jgi:hypothetical protein